MIFLNLDQNADPPDCIYTPKTYNTENFIMDFHS